MFQSILFLDSIKGGIYGKIGGFFWHRYLDAFQKLGKSLQAESLKQHRLGHPPQEKDTRVIQAG